MTYWGGILIYLVRRNFILKIKAILSLKEKFLQID